MFHVLLIQICGSSSGRGHTFCLRTTDNGRCLLTFICFPCEEENPYVVMGEGMRCGRVSGCTWEIFQGVIKKASNFWALEHDSTIVWLFDNEMGYSVNISDYVHPNEYFFSRLSSEMPDIYPKAVTIVSDTLGAPWRIFFKSMPHYLE